MNNFIYNIPTKVYFGENQLSNLGMEVSKFGKRVLLVYGGGSIKKIGLYNTVVKELINAGMEIYELNGVEPNPKIDSVRTGARICQDRMIDVVLAVGGGSVIDCAKFIAAATFYNGDAWDLSCKNVEITKCLPIVTILTLSATGSEMDDCGVISNPRTNDKIGRHHKLMQPAVSFLDPTLTYTVSRYQTACGAADILSHIFEVYFNLDKDLEMLDGFMETLMKTVIKFAPIALAEPTNYEARANLMWASSWAINGFIVGGKQQAWSCHPMEHQLSAVYDITHGLGLAILTPRWMRYYLNEKTLDKFVQFAVNVFDVNKNLPKMEIALKGIDLLEDFLFGSLNLTRRLSALNIDDSHFKEMSIKAATPNAFQPMSSVDVENIYRMCL